MKMIQTPKYVKKCSKSWTMLMTTRAVCKAAHNQTFESERMLDMVENKNCAVP